MSYILKRKIRKYRKKFVLPVLTSNGTMGGSTFAVDCSTHNASLYETFNAGSSGTKNVDTHPNAAPQWESFYSPVPLKVTQLRIGQIKDTSQAQYYYITAYKIQVSDDNQTWTDVYSGTGSKPATTLVADIEDSGYHKYYRAYIVSAQYYSGYPRVFFFGIDFDAEAEDDVFYDEVVKSYVVKRKVRKYYKYEYEDWAQPIATGATTVLPEGNMVVTATNQYAAGPYICLDGNTTTAWVMNETRIGFWQVKFPYKIKITGLIFYNCNGVNRTNTGRFYTDSTKGTPIGNAFQATNADFASTVIEGISTNGVETDTIYLDITSSNRTSSGMAELQITAQRKTGKVEVSASEDWDFYDDIVKSYVIKKKIRRYYKYEYEDWEQPNFTGYTTDGAVVSATSEDTGDGRFAWKALQTSTQPAANTNDNYGKYNTSTAVWKVKFPYLLKISKIEHQARNWNNSADYNTVGAYYADEDKTKKIGDINSSSSGAWTAFNVDYLTDTILLNMTGGGSWSGIGRLKITAQKATPVEVSVSDDWDYYEETTESYVIGRK